MRPREVPRAPQSAPRVTALAGVALLIGLTALVGEAGCTLDSPTDRPAKSRSGDAPGSLVPKASSGSKGSSEPKGPIDPGFRVTRVVDGDTVEVQRGLRVLTVRLIGIDTPETVHPSEPIECHGPAATRFARGRLLGRDVTLEYDPSQGRRDYYGRTLAYLWIEATPQAQFNRAAVRHGHALEYTHDTSYLWQSEFARAESVARHQQRGVWTCPQPGS